MPAAITALVISSAVAGAATAPFAAAHFNTIPHYGLLANLLAVPVMGSVVIPSAVLAVCLAPFGLEGIGLKVMQWGLDWILGVARFASSLDGALSHVPAPGIWVLPLLTSGALIAVIWQGRLRAAGLVPAAAALAVWAGGERPDILIADSGGLIGVMEADGRALSRAKGQGFTAGIWLENDGDPAIQADAAARWQGFAAELPAWQGPGFQLVHAPGERKLSAIEDCKNEEIIVSTVEAKQLQDCLILTPKVMWQTGSIAISRNAGMLTARDVAGERLWTNWQPEGKKIARLRRLFRRPGNSRQ